MRHQLIFLDWSPLYITNGDLLTDPSLRLKFTTFVYSFEKVCGYNNDTSKSLFKIEFFIKTFLYVRICMYFHKDVNFP